MRNKIQSLSALLSMLLSASALLSMLFSSPPFSPLTSPPSSPSPLFPPHCILSGVLSTSSFMSNSRPLPPQSQSTIRDLERDAKRNTGEMRKNLNLDGDPSSPLRHKLHSISKQRFKYLTLVL